MAAQRLLRCARGQLPLPKSTTPKPSDADADPWLQTVLKRGEKGASHIFFKGLPDVQAQGFFDTQSCSAFQQIGSQTLWIRTSKAFLRRGP